MDAAVTGSKKRIITASEAGCLSYYGVPDTSSPSPVSTMKANLCTIWSKHTGT